MTVYRSAPPPADPESSGALPVVRRRRRTFRALLVLVVLAVLATVVVVEVYTDAAFARSKMARYQLTHATRWLLVAALALASRRLPRLR